MGRFESTMRLLFTCLLFCCFSMAFCQSDILVLRKHHQNIAQYYAGRNITFFLDGMEQVTGHIKNIAHDTLYINTYETRMLISNFGTWLVDTFVVHHEQYNYHSIVAFPKDEKLPFFNDGSLFMIAGGGYAGLNLINAAIEKEMVGRQENIIRLASAAVVFGIGYLMKKTYKNYILIGNKYQLLYLGVKDGKPIDKKPHGIVL